MSLKKKIYISVSGDVSFIYSVEVNGVSVNHTFTLDNAGKCAIIDPAKQKAIENSKYFKKGWIKIHETLEPSAGELFSYEKQLKREKRIIEIASSDPVKSKIVQEMAQMKVNTGNEVKSLEDEILDDIEKDDAGGASNDPEGGKDESNKEDNDNKPDVKIYETSNIQEAKEIIRKLGVPFQKLNNPENIKKQAGLLGIEFPNLK